MYRLATLANMNHSRHEETYISKPTAETTQSTSFCENPKPWNSRIHRVRCDDVRRFSSPVIIQNPSVPSSPLPGRTRPPGRLWGLKEEEVVESFRGSCMVCGETLGVQMRLHSGSWGLRHAAACTESSKGHTLRHDSPFFRGVGE